MEISMKYRSLAARQPGGLAATRRTVLSAFVVATALLAASCGGNGSVEISSDAGTNAPADSGDDAEASSAPSDAFPDTEVLNLGDGSNVGFNEVASSAGEPVLLWFYFPH